PTSCFRCLVLWPSQGATLKGCDSPIFTGGKIEAKHNREKVSLRIGLAPCPHHGPVRLRLSTRQSAELKAEVARANGQDNDIARPCFAKTPFDWEAVDSSDQ